MEEWLDDGVEVAVVLGLAAAVSILFEVCQEKLKLTFANPMKVSLPSGLFGPAFLSSFSIVVSTGSGGGGGTGGPFYSHLLAFILGSCHLRAQSRNPDHVSISCARVAKLTTDSALL